jgi:Uma2 family endonuclease
MQSMNDVARIPATMTVEEFQHWRPPADLRDRRWQLLDGEPRCIAPASEDHGAIRREAAFLLNRNLSASYASWRVVTSPSVIPHVRADFNERVPDFGVTRAPAAGKKVISDPVFLIEILSPSSENDTWANVFAYATIPSVQEMLVLDSTAIAAELVTRRSDGYWPKSPLLLGPEDQVRLSSLGFEAPLRAFYVGTILS